MMTDREPRAAARPGARLPHLPGLDGLRAVSVIAVVLWHIAILAGDDPPLPSRWFVGGYLGVEVFFVISGYLITSLLLLEFRGSGGIGFRDFYVRRARRLLPALFVMLAAVVGYMAVFLPEELGTIKKDVLASLFYVTNFLLMFDQRVYGAKAPLEHLWSLAVEEQYYLLWPVVLFFGLRRFGRWRFVRATVVVALVASIGTAVVFWTTKTGIGTLRFGSDGDATPLYVNSITRSSGLLLGSAFAFVFQPRRLTAKVAPAVPYLYDAVGVAAALALGWMFISLDYFADGARRFLYGWSGFLVIDLLTVLLIATVVHPASHLGRVFGHRWLEVVGQRSYGIYLWQGPVIAFTEPGRDALVSGFWNQALRILLIAGLSELSFRFVEQPIRGGLIGRVWQTLRSTSGATRERLAARAYGSVAACGVLVLGLGTVLYRADVPTNVAQKGPDGRPSAASTRTTLVQGATSTSSTPTGAPGASTTTAAGPNINTRQVTFIGDSVMLGASNYRGIQNNVPGQLRIDAAQNRQAYQGVEIAQAMRDAGTLGDVVVVHLGTNGTFSAETFEKLMQIVGPQRTVVAVNVRVPRTWEPQVNGMLAQEVRKYPNARLVDWHKVGNRNPQIFARDGIHLGQEGANLYGSLIRDTVVEIAP